MGVYGGPELVTDGLVLCVDGNNTKSYSYGLTLDNLSQSNYRITLVNGATVSGGAIILDGTNDYAYLASHDSNLAFPNGSMTLIVWEKLISFVNFYGGIISTDTGGDLYWKIFRDGFYNYSFRWGSGTFPFPSLTMNTWIMYCAVKDSSTNLKLYFNGKIASSHTVSATIPTQNNPITIGSYRYDNAIAGAFLNNQAIGQIAIYNRALSDEEVAQNYVALRGRFGI